MELDLDDVEAIVVLGETLHFGRAAERLHVSQPALSKRIRRLEERVGGPLLVRKYRDVRLTEAGRLLAGRGRQLLHESAASLALSRRAARGEAGVLRIGFGIASILGLLPAVLLRFRQAYPDVELQLRDMSTPEQVNALGEGAIDVGFVRLPVADRRLQMRPVIHERLVAALGPRSPWRRKLGLRSVAAEPFIIIARARSASFYDHALSICAASGFAPRVVQEANELFTVLSLVGAGLGVSLVPRSAALMRLPGVRFREVNLPEAAWNIALAWRRDAGPLPLVEQFVAMVSASRVVPPRSARTSAPRTTARRSR
jgi:DNA-binding transcriptional LysR family regulator